MRKPPALAKLEASLSSEGYHAWVKAREAKDGAGDFALFAPALTKLVKLRRDIAAHCAPHGTATYDFCIDQYERGVSSARIREVRLSQPSLRPLAWCLSHNHLSVPAGVLPMISPAG